MEQSLELKSLRVSPVETTFNYGDDLEKSYEDLLKDMTPADKEPLDRARNCQNGKCEQKGKTIEECENEDKGENKSDKQEIEEKSRKGLFINLEHRSCPFFQKWGFYRNS